MNKKPKVEPVIYKPSNCKRVHIFPGGFKGGIGKSLCGSLFHGVNPVRAEFYAASDYCRACVEAADDGAV